MTRVRLTPGASDTCRTSGGLDLINVPQAYTGIVAYGPYEWREAGRYRARFMLGLGDAAIPVGDSICLRIDVVTGQGKVLLAERHILFSQLGRNLMEFDLPFDLIEARELEYRIHATGQVAVEVGRDVDVEPLPAQPLSRPGRGSREREWENEREFLDGYLRNIAGVIHVGGNLGQERRYYWLIGVDVLWVEPIREIYEQMVDNISSYPRQRGVNALLGARDGEEVVLGIANNNGASSSILALDEHSILFPDIEYVEQRKLTTMTLGAMIEHFGIRIEDYQALTLDTEGAELMILQGAGDMLRHFQYIKCEVADFSARAGTPSSQDLDMLLTGLGFSQLARRSFGMGPGGIGTFWDIVWKRQAADEPLHEPGYALPLVMNPTEVLAVEKCE